MKPLMSIKNLHVHYKNKNSLLHALRGITLDITEGECLAIVGESGCGKSTLVKACMGLLGRNAKITSGNILCDQYDIAQFNNDKDWERANLRGRRIAMVMQNPMNSLNPIYSVGKQISESFLYSKGISRRKSKPQVFSMLRDAGFDNPEIIYNQYPGQLSGGMNQRIAITMAVACSPKILFCDECTSSLDVTTQASVLDYIRQLQKRHGMAIVLVTHDMGIVAKMADRVGVMYAGELVEIGTCREIFFDPRHPYTWSLFSALPQISGAGENNIMVKGTPPDLCHEIKGDAFAARNPYTVLEIDKEMSPPVFQISPTHSVRTWLADSRAPKVEPPKCLKNIKSLLPFWEE